MKQSVLLAVLLCSCGIKVGNGGKAAPPETGPKPSNTDSSVVESESSTGPKVDKPVPDLGILLTAEVVAEKSSRNTVLIGVIGFLDNKRISENENKYTSSWTLRTALSPDLVNISKSTLGKYDQIIEYVGSYESLKKDSPTINVVLQFRQIVDGVGTDNIAESDLKNLLFAP